MQAATGCGSAQYRDLLRQAAFDGASLMAHAQDGDREAYRRLLHRITPYLRLLALQGLGEQPDVEETVQDILRTVHAIRHTYDPGRPFGPWLRAIADRRMHVRSVAKAKRATLTAPDAVENATVPRQPPPQNL